MNWTPRDADPATHHTLVDGIPHYMQSPLRSWFNNEFTYVAVGGYQRHYSIERMENYDLASKDTLVEALRSYGPNSIFDDMTSAEKLRIIEWTVFDNAWSAAGIVRNNDLEQILSLGSSLWKVGFRDGHAGLERRVPEGVQDAAEAAMATSGDSGRLLS